jgi:hypothetical protein
MTRLRLVILGGILITNGILCWILQYRAGVAMRETKASFRAESERLAGLAEESERLSNGVARLGRVKPLSDDEFHELLRLRGRMGGLRVQTNELNQLRATNQLLRIALAQSQNISSGLIFRTRDQLDYVGYADPESALVTTFWALSNVDPNVWRSLLTEDEKTILAGNSLDLTNYWQRMGEMLNPSSATGIRFLGQKENTPDEVILDVHYEGEGKTRRFVMKRIDGVWRLQDLVCIIAD